MASPFKRKPALVRTYGSSSSAQPPPPPPKPLSALDRLLADSDSSDEDGLAGEKTAQAPAPKRAKTAATAKGKDPVSRSRPRSTSAAALLDDDDDADQSRWEENQAALSAQTRASRSGGATAVTSTRSRTKSSGSQQQQQQRTSPRKRAAHTPVYDEQEGAGSAEDEEVLPRPSPPRRKVKRTDSSNNHSDPAATLTRTGKPSNATTSIPTAAAPSSKKKKPPPPSSKDRNLGKAVERDDDEIPAPTAFVPLAERLKQASHGSHDQSSSANQPPRARERRTPSPSPPKRPRPRKAATAPTPTPTPALSSPRRPPPADDQSSPLSPAKPTPGATRRPAASPVKDLSAVFSRFATRTAAPIATTTSSSSSSGGVVVSVEQHKEEPSLLEGADSGPRAQVSQRPPAARPTAGLKRARSLVGGMAGPIAKRLGGTTRSPNSGDDDPDGDGDGGLGRTFSQPGSSVLSPPSRPNRPRPPLGSSLSVPVILSPTKSSPVRGGGGGGGGNEIASPTTTVGGGGSGSPLRRPHSPNVGLGAGGSGNGGLAALLGGAGAMTAEGNGPTRTYASGRRTVRAPVEPAEEGGGGGGEAFASARTATTSRMLATVPGSSRPQSGDASTLKASSMVGVAAPPPRRETYASLRLLWGIDAEENLDADEDQDSQDRGAKVVGSGTLRRQGEGKRWMDELGWMCDGLRAGGGGEGGGDRGAARASAIELVGKALEKDWIRRLKSSGQAETVYLALRTATSSGGGSNSNATPRTPATMTADRVLDAAIAVTLALFVKDQRLVEPLLRISPADVQRNAATRKTASPPDDPEDEPGSDGNSDLLEVLTALLNREWASDEIGATKTAAAAGQNQAGGTSGRSRVSKVLKSDTRHLQALRDLIDKSSLFSADDAAALPVSIRSLVLLTIRSIAFFAPRPIFQPQSMLCTAGVLEHVVRDFLNECAGLQARISKYQEGLDLLAPPPAQPQVSIPILSLHLSIFEATSLVGPLAFELISSPDLLPPLSLAFTQLAHVAILLALDRNPGPPSTSRVPAASEDALRTLVAVLGILLALSSDERWSVAFVEAELLPTLVRAALLSRRVAGEGVSLSAPTEAAAEEAPQPSSPSQGGTDAAASDATTTTTSSEAEEVAAATAAAGDGNGRSRLIWDVLSLSVGVLANVLDATPESQVGDSLLELSVNPACRGKRKCARACRCPDDEQETALAALCRLAIDPLDDAVDPVYRASVHGFLRLALGLSLLSSEAAESTITAALEAHPVVLGHVLDALEGFASLYDEREQARRSMLALPSAGRVAQASGANVAHGQRDLDDDDDDNEEKEEEEPTQVDLDETQLGEGEGDGKRVEAGDADSERIVRMREVVQRLRRRVR